MQYILFPAVGQFLLTTAFLPPLYSKRNLAVSYLIVDEAEEEMEMETDPFLEAGIQIPTNLPQFKDKTVNLKDLRGEGGEKTDTMDALGTTTPAPAQLTPQLIRRKGSKTSMVDKIRGSFRDLPELTPSPSTRSKRNQRSA